MSRLDWKNHGFELESILTEERTEAGREHKWHPAVAEERLAKISKSLAQGRPEPRHKTEHHEAFRPPPPVMEFIFSKGLDSERSHKDKFQYIKPHDTEALKASRVSAYSDHFAERPKMPSRVLREKHIEVMRNAAMMAGEDISSLDSRKRPPHQKHGEVGTMFGQGTWHLSKPGVLPKAAEAATTGLHPVEQDRFHPSKIKITLGSSSDGVKVHVDPQTGRPMWPLSAREFGISEHQASFSTGRVHPQKKQLLKYQKKMLKGIQNGSIGQPRQTTH